MTFAQLQSEQREWSLRNFGPHPAWHPQLGMIEEIGELSHAHLKAAQGIRGTAEEHHAAKVDAVADCVIYLADYCTCRGWDLAEEVRYAVDTVRNIEGFPSEQLIIYACHSAVNGDPRSLIHNLIRYCASQGIDFEKAVFSTWESVRQRDWTKKEGMWCR